MRGHGIALGVVVAVVGCTAEPPGFAPSPGVAAAALPPPAVVGVVGCDARNCHGSLEAAPRPLDFAATAWRKWDKHGRAFAALQSERSADLVARLGPGWRPAPREARCLACHAVPALATGSSPLLADGVGCEACHTAPGRSTGDWLTAHWQPNGVAGSYADGAMRRLDTASRRAAACVGCHVGAPAADGVPAREVTHDLIAAGHPRLNFDLLTFLELMPPHWPKTRDTEAAPTAWQAGQVEAAKAALTLAAGRPAGPELADRTCFACHHQPGLTPPPAGWTSPLVSAPLANLLGWGEAERAALAAADPTALRNLRDRLTPGPVDAARLTAAVAGGDWDAAAQGYYALRAAGRSGPALDRLADALRLRPTATSPAGYDAAAVAKLLREAAR